MRNAARVEGDDRQQGHEVVLRFGGSTTGVGLAAGVLYLVGSDSVLMAPMAAALLLVGMALLIIGYRARRKNRR